MSTVVPSASNFTLPPTDEVRLQPVRDRIRQGLAWRKQFEPTWISNLAYAAGKHDLVWDRFERKLSLPRELEGQDLYTADVITEQRQAMLGDLRAGDDRPQMITVVDGASAESIAEQANRVLRWGWEEEWHADEILLDMRRKLLDFGVSAVLPYFDKTLGQPRVDLVPHRDGRPVTDLAQAREYVATQQQNGQSADLRPINDGKICWKVGSPFNLVVPPGVVHERGFPWEVWAAPTPVDWIRDNFGSAAAGINEDPDIRSDIGLTSSSSATIGGEAERGASDQRLRDHAWLYHYYERPTAKFRKGRCIWLATNQLIELEEEPQLPHQAPDGSWRSGIEYFHMWRRNDLFWSRAFIEGLKDPQRMIDRRKRQEIEIVDRGMPKVFVEEGSIVKEPEGHPLEIIELKKGVAPPNHWGGQGPGTWMEQAIAGHREDLAHASTLSAVRLGENPANVDNYSQLALINENEQQKRQNVVDEHQTAIRLLVEDSLELADIYWSDGKMMALSGDDRIDQFEYKKTMIPRMYKLRAATGSGQPRTLGAELTRIHDISQYAIQSAQPLPVSWYAESLAAGEALEIPEPAVDDQMKVAYLENTRLLEGMKVVVMYWDNPATHVPIHRLAENQARMAGDVNGAGAVEQHIQDHIAQAQANAQMLQVAQQTPSPFGPNAPPGPVGPAAQVPGSPPGPGGPAPGPPQVGPPQPSLPAAAPPG